MVKLKEYKISIAMTTYNGAQYLIEQLDSIRNQMRPPDEVIICDDCSTDESYEMVVNFIEKHQLTGWVIFRNQRNLGFIENFRKTILMTTGDIIFLADQDDIWRIDKIEKMINVFENNEDAEVVACKNLLIDGEGNNIKTYWEFSNDVKKLSYNDVFKSSRGTWKGCLTAFGASTRDDIKEYGFFDNSHDGAITVLGLIKNAYYSVDMPLINYRLHESNTASGFHVNSTQKLSNDLQLRIKELREIHYLESSLKIAKLIDNENVISGLKNHIFTRKVRADAMEKKNILLFLKYRKQILEITPPQTIFSDIVYILHLRNVFIKITRR